MARVLLRYVFFNIRRDRKQKYNIYNIYLVCRRCGASREASRQGSIVLVLLQSTESVYTHNDTNLLVELLEHHEFCFYGPRAAQRNASYAASGWHSQLVLRCHWDGHGAVSLHGTSVILNINSTVHVSLSCIGRLDGSEKGSTCLLRSICEISQLPFNGNNIFSDILNAILMWVSFLNINLDTHNHIIQTLVLRWIMFRKSISMHEMPVATAQTVWKPTTIAAQESGTGWRT